VAEHNKEGYPVSDKVNEMQSGMKSEILQGGVNGALKGCVRSKG
jgi:hypothetical protein